MQEGLRRRTRDVRQPGARSATCSRTMHHGGSVALLGIPPGDTAIDWNQVIFKGLNIARHLRPRDVRDLVQDGGAAAGRARHHAGDHAPLPDPGIPAGLRDHGLGASRARSSSTGARSLGTFGIGRSGDHRSARRVEPACRRLQLAFIPARHADIGLYRKEGVPWLKLSLASELDWLRKTAKQTLRNLRAQRPEARVSPTRIFLPSAQSRDSRAGAQLKAHVDKLLKPEAVALDDAGRAVPARCADRNTDAVRTTLHATRRWSMPTVHIRTGEVARSRFTWRSKERIAKHLIYCSRPAPT